MMPFKCKDLVVWPLLDAYDMCSAVENVEWGEVTETQLSCPNHWEMSRWAYAVDACGNADSTQYFIEVLDDEAPEINYVPLGFSKSCDDIPVLENAIAIDNCLGEVDITVETDTVFGDCPQTYTMTRTFTATDNCGNSSTAQQLIIVEDFQSPQLTVPDDYTVECSDEIIFDPPIAFDNCDDTPLVEEEQEIVNVQSTGTYTLRESLRSQMIVAILLRGCKPLTLSTRRHHISLNSLRHRSSLRRRLPNRSCRVCRCMRPKPRITFNQYFREL